MKFNLTQRIIIPVLSRIALLVLMISFTPPCSTGIAIETESSIYYRFQSLLGSYFEKIYHVHVFSSLIGHILHNHDELISSDYIGHMVH
jgi:hypothetical protein